MRRREEDQEERLVVLRIEVGNDGNAHGARGRARREIEGAARVGEVLADGGGALLGRVGHGHGLPAGSIQAHREDGLRGNSRIALDNADVVHGQLRQRVVVQNGADGIAGEVDGGAEGSGQRQVERLVGLREGIAEDGNRDDGVRFTGRHGDRARISRVVAPLDGRPVPGRESGRDGRGARLRQPDREVEVPHPTVALRNRRVRHVQAGDDRYAGVVAD